MIYLIPGNENCSSHWSERWALKLQSNCATSIYHNIKPNVANVDWGRERDEIFSFSYKRINAYCCDLHNNLLFLTILPVWLMWNRIVNLCRPTHEPQQCLILETWWPVLATPTHGFWFEGNWKNTNSRD